MPSALRFSRPVLAIAVIAVLAGVVFLVVKQPWRKAPETIAVTRTTLREVVEVSGVVKAARAVTLKAETTGAVQALVTPENRAVKDGQALLKLDDTQAQLQLDQARTSMNTAIAQARTQLTNGRATQAETGRRQRVSLQNLQNRVSKADSALAFLARETARSEGLLAEGAITAQAVAQQRQSLTQARLDLRLARDELARAASGAELVTSANALAQAATALANAERQGQAATRLAQKAVDDCVVKAPFAGTVTDWLIDPGAWVTPGFALAQFQDLADLRLELPLDELDLPKLRTGMTASITFDAFADEPMSGTIVSISRASVVGTGNVQVFPIEVRFANPGQRVRPGMSGDARIAVREVANVIAVPIGAVKRVQDRYTVDVVKDGKSESRPITPGIATLEQIEVKEGLAEGERITFEGAVPSPKP